MLLCSVCLVCVWVSAEPESSSLSPHLSAWTETLCWGDIDKITQEDGADRPELREGRDRPADVSKIIQSVPAICLIESRPLFTKVLPQTGVSIGGLWLFHWGCQLSTSLRRNCRLFFAPRLMDDNGKYCVGQTFSPSPCWHTDTHFPSRSPAPSCCFMQKCLLVSSDKTKPWPICLH